MNSHPQRRGRLPGSGQHDVPQIGTVIELRSEKRNTFGRRDESTHIAIAQDVADLLGLEQRIDRNERASRRRRAENCRDEFRPLIEIDPDALAARQSNVEQPTSEALQRLCQGAITSARGLIC